jgi:hypothetical protein
VSRLPNKRMEPPGAIVVHPGRMYVGPSRGDPIAPGATVLNTFMLQDAAGYEWPRGSHLFRYRLMPGQYALHVEFAAHYNVAGTTPLLVEATPILFRVRERTTAEDDEVTELLGIRDVGWDTRVPRAPHALLATRMPCSTGFNGASVITPTTPSCRSCWTMACTVVRRSCGGRLRLEDCPVLTTTPVRSSAVSALP